jgi:prepilin-type processing-associated H-X9-DG protein
VRRVRSLGAGPMSIRYAMAVLVAVVAVVAGRDARAHHSVAGEFDVRKIVNLSGVVSDVEWANPHIYIHLDVKGATGTTTWRLESVPVGMMRKAGLSKVLLVGNGQMATVEAYLARDGTPHLGYLVNITYADGHHYQFASDK